MKILRTREAACAIRLLLAVTSLALASCGTEATRTTYVDESTAPRISVPTGSSVAEARRIGAANEAARTMPPMATVAGGTDAIHVLLADMGTGCQYVLRTTHQSGSDLSPRMERTPGLRTASRQRCGKPKEGSDEIRVLSSDGPTQYAAAVEADRETGCQYLVVVNWRDDVASTPRTVADGDLRLQKCDGPTGGR